MMMSGRSLLKHITVIISRKEGEGDVLNAAKVMQKNPTKKFHGKKFTKKKKKKEK